MTYADGLNELRRMVTEHAAKNLLPEDATESDTRAKVIDRTLRAVLGWPETTITREDRVDAGYIDYTLHAPNPVLLVEAKRSSRTFEFPIEKRRRHYKLNSLRSYPDLVGDAIVQARSYADELGIEYACATNGLQWLVFRAITRGSSWKEGDAIVFRSLDDIADKFTEFWNLLSYDAVTEGGLAQAFQTSSREQVAYSRALDDLLFAENPLERNTLSAQLQPLISILFRDLTGPEQDEILNRCYVHDRKVVGVWKEVEELFADTVPDFAKKAGFIDLVETKERSGALDSDFKRAIERGDFGVTVLLLGGVGCGKTTFTHRFFRVTAKKFVDEHCAWFYVPFTKAPLNSDDFGAFVRLHIRTSLGQKYPDIDTKSIAALRHIYSSELKERAAGPWAMLDEPERNRREADLLERLVAADKHCDAVLRYLRSRGMAVTIVLDNVDQRDPAEQARIFLLAHELCHAFDAIVIVTLREESFFKASQAGAFNAYHNIRYHIASPDVRTLLGSRIDYALDVAEQGTDALRLVLRSGLEFKAPELRSFMEILKEGTLKTNPAICQFIDSVSHGDMRLALDMFNQFMVSGSLNVEKMLRIHREQGRYNVAEHEFMKAVMLGDFQFYRDRRSAILNVFEVSPSATSSGLTALRVLQYLSRRSGHSHSEGTGYVELEKMLHTFAETFGDSDDAAFHVLRLLDRRLVQSNTQATKELSGIEFIRITRCGLYYVSTLMRRFAYLTLVAGDTPMWDRRAVQEVRSRVTNSDLYERATMVEWLLTYLRKEEARSLSAAPRELARSAFGDAIMAYVEQGYRDDLERVGNRTGLDRSARNRIRESVAAAAG